MPNLTAGPQITHFKFKDARDFKGQTHVTKFPSNKIKIHQFTVGIRSTYYLNDLITNLLGIKMNKSEVHVSGFGGMNLLAGVDTARINRDTIPTIGFGIMVGTGFQYNENLGFFIEGGYSTFGVISFGIKYIIGGKYEQ